MKTKRTIKKRQTKKKTSKAKASSAMYRKVKLRLIHITKDKNLEEFLFDELCLSQSNTTFFYFKPAKATMVVDDATGEAFLVSY